ncbi:MAG: cobyrinic acid a,c-diamide synthase [Leptolyngbyaceae cyanobacterium]
MVFVQPDNDPIFGSLPAEAKTWLEGLPWEQRRYVLSLCHLMSASSPEVQADFLDDYTADGLVYRVIQDQDTTQKVSGYLQQFHITTKLTEAVLRSYIRQFYIHTAQDARQQPDLYLESALRLMISSQERKSVFSYVLGFELMKLIFQMSWAQQERLYRLQVSQEDFIRSYIKPIRHAHRLNSIIVPKDEEQFFARRAYYIRRPQIRSKQLIELVMATFTSDIVSNLGFEIIRTPKAFQFDYSYIYAAEPIKTIFD